jgi:superfamily II DNA/RNA helicase
MGSIPARPVTRLTSVACGPGVGARRTHEKGTVLNTPSFADLGVLPSTVAGLEAVGITSPFPIQALTLPVALHGHDIIGQAKTGTGKTLGFGIPLLQRVVVDGEDHGDPALPPPVPGKPQALVVVPTRELCVQVSQDLEKASAKRDLRVLSIYGGRAYEPQVEALRRGIEVVVGTPGRLIDLAQQGHLDLGHVRTLVLDEADEMLDLGFLPDVEKIVRLVPAGRQTMLFSATMPGAIITLARAYMHHPTHIRAVDPDDDGLTVKAVEQHAFRAHAMDKVEMLARILQSEGRGLTLVFCRTKRTAAKVADDLADRGFASGAVHGDLGQGAREQALRAFRNGKVDVLVATDVAARGIDVQDITHVVNYQCPEDEKTYLHRIGRTARAGAKGIAITFVDWDDMPRWSLIDRALDLGFGEPEETYSSSDHLYEELEFPRHVTGVLPRAQRTREGLDAEVLEDLGETGRAGAGARGGGGRSGGGRGRDAGRGGARDRTREVEGERRERPRRERSRRRTRGGAPADGSAAAAATASPAADASDGEGGPAPRRRRRSRGGRGGGGAGNGSGTTGGDTA